MKLPLKDGLVEVSDAPLEQPSLEDSGPKQM
jgi:hypothetical protein